MQRGYAIALDMIALAAGMAVGCGRSNDSSGHNTYQSQPGDAPDAGQTADTARDTAAPRVSP
jgi:hypothetical protein